MRKLSLLLALMLFSAAQLLAQRTITGTVTGDDGKTLPAVTVLVNGDIKQAAQTDVSGNYTIKVPANAKFLRFSFVGMKTEDVELTSSNNMNISLQPEASQLEGVVVTGYVVRGKNQLTGSTVQVKSEDLKNSAAVSVDQALQGKVAGLAISASSGTPGSIQDIRVRGAGSLSASNDPLIVIDGVPVINPNLTGSTASSSLSALSAINNDDIESLTVLKDASATAAYGARGSNGVIVITTKKGKEGNTKFNFSAYYGFQNRAIEGRKQLTGMQKEELFADAIYNSFNGVKDKDTGITPKFAKAEAINWFIEEDKTKADYKKRVPTAYLNWVKDGRPDNDWNKVMINKNAPLFNAQLSAQGGSRDASFYASVGFNKTENIVIGSDFKRINGSLNYTRNFTDKIKFSTTNTVSNVRQNGLLLEQSAYYGNPIMARYFANSWYSPFLKDGTPNLSTGSVYNWLYIKDRNVAYNDYTRALSNSLVEWEFWKNLKFKSVISLDYGITQWKDYRNRYHGDGRASGGSSEKSSTVNFVYVTQNSLNYTATIKDDHYVSALVLVEYQKSKRDYLYGIGRGFITDNLTDIDITAKNWQATSSFSGWQNVSYLGMLNYTYAGKYVADLTFRREGSSRFADGKRFGSFGSIGLAWNIHNEDFFYPYKNIVDNLRLRASYGISGNSDINIEGEIGNNVYQAMLGYRENYSDQGASYPIGYGNSDLTWEKNNTLDVGVDFALLKNRINGSIAYFNKLTTDLIQPVPLPNTSGFKEVIKNSGSILNQGVEAILNIHAVKTNDFNLNLTMNIATLQNKVLKLAKDSKGKDLVIETGTRKTAVGHIVNEWYMQKWAGVDPKTGNPQWYINGKDGDVTTEYKNAGKDFQGYSPLPKYSGGFGLNVDYKGVYLNTNFYFAGGHKVYESWVRYYFSDGRYSFINMNGVADLMNRWQKEGEQTDVPRMVYEGTSDGNYAAYNSSRFLFKGDYLRLKDITLGYNFPKNILNKIHYKGTLSVFAKGTNLWTLVADKNMKYDPEVRADGYTAMTNPPVKSIIFGVNLNF